MALRTEVQDHEVDEESLDSAKGIEKLTTVATTLGGSAALGLLAAAIMPEMAVVVTAAVFGSLAGFFARGLDKQVGQGLTK